MLSRSLVVSRTLDNELERNLVTKLKADLDESSSSLKTTLEAMRLLDEKYRQVSAEADETKNKVATLEANFQIEKTDSAKIEEEAATEKKTMTEKLEYYESFFLCINK